MIRPWRCVLCWAELENTNLRRLADNIEPEEVIDLTIKEEDEAPVSVSNDPQGLVCPICMAIVKIPVATNCGHIFCSDCLDCALEVKKACPLCASEVSCIVRLFCD